jgi:photosystem II stability/assembly factor-like uncharacterized protein
MREKFCRMRAAALALSLVPLLGGCLSSQKSEAPALLPALSDNWRVLGPGGGGSHFRCTVSPYDPDFVFSACDMTGSQVTWDGGRTWRNFNLRTVIADFEFDPGDPNVVYASNTGLYRSENKGQTWRLVYPDPKNVIAERMVGDHAEQWFETPDSMPDGIIEQVLVDPSDSRRLYLGIAAPVKVSAVTGPRVTRNTVKVLTSADRGSSWKMLSEVPGQHVLALLPGSWQGKAGLVTVFTDLSCTALSDKPPAAVELPLPAGPVLAADGGSGPEGTLFYILTAPVQSGDTVAGGIYRSADGGGSWTQVLNGLLDDYPVTASLPYFKTLAVCENAPRVVYLSAHIYIDEIPWMPDRPRRDRKFGIFKTDNAGDDWRWVYCADEDSVFSKNYAGAWEDRDYGPEWGESPHSFGVYPADPQTCYVTDNRTYRTRDGGAKWEQVYSDEQPDGSWSSRGIDVTTTYGVHFDPFDPNHLFISYTDIGLFQSYNGGRSWVHSLKGIPLEWINTTYWLVFDPDALGRIWTVRSDWHDLPRLKMFRSGALARGEPQGGVALSNDGGETWQPSGVGIPPNTVCTHILLDTESLAYSRTLYVCSMIRGVYKSTDGGKTWRNASNGLGPNRNAWRMVRTPDGTLYLLVCRALDNGQVLGGGLYRSRDGADTWEPLPLPAGVDGPNDLVCDPSEPNRMYLSCWPFPKDGRETGGGLLRTEDGGLTWKRVFQEDAHVYAAAVDPSNPSTVVFNTYDSAAFRSDDRGDSWRRLRGYNFKWGQRPVFDPNHPGMLFLTTFGGSVFYGPSAGDPDAVEDIEDGTYLRWAGFK